MRTRSAQKLPSVSPRLAAKARATAAATAIPAAAEAKFCTVNPAICERWLAALSPEQNCQLVLVTKLMAVLNDSSGVMPGKPCGLSGSTPCSLRIAYRKKKAAALKARNDKV